MKDGFLVACEAAFDWAEDRDVELRLHRDADMLWCFRLTFADYHGRWFEDVSVGKLPGNGERRAYIDDLRSRLDSGCAAARARRLATVKQRLH